MPFRAVQPAPAVYAGRDPVDQQADTIGLSQFAPISNGNIHCKNYPAAPDMTKTALDGYIWRGASMTGGGIHSSEGEATYSTAVLRFELPFLVCRWLSLRSNNTVLT
eukprot:SAG22_NODE_13_length_33548_cov_57.167773_14_plen_107_part_00